MNFFIILYLPIYILSGSSGCFVLLYSLFKKYPNLILPTMRRGRGLLRGAPQQPQSQWAGQTVPLLQAARVNKGDKHNWTVWICLLGSIWVIWKPLKATSGLCFFFEYPVWNYGNTTERDVGGNCLEKTGLSLPLDQVRHTVV